MKNKTLVAALLASIVSCSLLIFVIASQNITNVSKGESVAEVYVAVSPTDTAKQLLAGDCITCTGAELLAAYNKLPDIMSGDLSLPAWSSTGASADRAKINKIVKTCAPPGTQLSEAVACISKALFKSSSDSELSQNADKYVSNSIENLAKQYKLTVKEATCLFAALKKGTIKFTLVSLSFKPGPLLCLGFGSKFVYTIKKGSLGSQNSSDAVQKSSLESFQACSQSFVPEPYIGLMHSDSFANGFNLAQGSVAGEQMSNENQEESDYMIGGCVKNAKDITIIRSAPPSYGYPSSSCTTDYEYSNSGASASGSYDMVCTASNYRDHNDNADPMIKRNALHIGGDFYADFINNRTWDIAENTRTRLALNESAGSNYLIPLHIRANKLSLGSASGDVVVGEPIACRDLGVFGSVATDNGDGDCLVNIVVGGVSDNDITPSAPVPYFQYSISNDEGYKTTSPISNQNYAPSLAFVSSNSRLAVGTVGSSVSKNSKVTVSGGNFRATNNTVRLTNNDTGNLYTISGVNSDGNKLVLSLPTNVPVGSYTLKTKTSFSDWSKTLSLIIAWGNSSLPGTAASTPATSTPIL
ncbi:MAG: hypothetical protein WCK03_00645 [Candidatus Taylorbacteria bacterium]